jgi:TonB family protein
MVMDAITLLNLLLKSAAILGGFVLLDFLIGKRLGSNGRHLLWLNALFCLSVLPLLSIFVGRTPVGDTAASAWFEITVTPAAAEIASGSLSTSWWIMLYFIPSLWLLAKMGVALLRLGGVRQRSELVTHFSTVALLNELKSRVGVSRNIVLRRSKSIDSPMSFGLFSPHIVLPAQSANWSKSVMTDVLLHELSHIKRLDWITMMIAWLVASIYWINPLVWFVIKRLNDEAENSCDTAVLHAGRSDTDYAESLLSVAKACVHSAQSARAAKLPAQMMLDRSTLKNRIHRILEEHTINTPERKQSARNEWKKTSAVLLLLSSGILGSFGTSQLLSAQVPDPVRAPDPTQKTVNREMIPLHSEIPQYPTAAAEGGIEGWVQVRFTVTAAGTVDPDSVAVVDAEPADIFNASAQRAALRFAFSPRIVDGQAVDVPNVQYVFRYQLKEGSEQQLAP